MSYLVRSVGRLSLLVTLLIGGVLLLAVTGSLLVVVLTARQQDALALAAERRLAETAIATRTAKLTSIVKEYTWWNETLEKMQGPQGIDLDWADGNLGPWIYNSYGYEGSFFLDPDGGIVYAMLDGERVEGDRLGIAGGELAALRAEALIAPLDDPKGAGGIVMTERGPALVGLDAVTPEDPEGEAALAILAAEAAGRKVRGFIVFIDLLDRDVLEEMGEAYLLQDANFATETASPAALPLTSPGGATVGALQWVPSEPGDDLLRNLLPVLGLVGLGALALTACVAVYLRRSTKAIQVAQTALIASETRFRDVAEAASDWIWETDAKMRLTYVSERFTQATDLPAEIVKGMHLRMFACPDEGTRNEFEAMLAEQRGLRDVRCRYHTAGREERFCRLSARPVPAPDGSFAGYRGTATDITHEVRAQARIEHLSLHDPLTGLANRVLLRERLSQTLALAAAQGTLTAVLWIDLDRFKEANDTLGHAAGDALLKIAAERLRVCARDSDTVARVGGDEFVLVLTNLREAGQAQDTAERLLEAFSVPIDCGGDQAFVLGLSIGIACAPDDGRREEALLNRADMALYQAKRDGRGAWRRYLPEMDKQLRERRAIETDLRDALARGQFELHYQPRVEARSGRMVGVEALLRWHHPERGLVSPCEFINIAEETGLIVPIGAWVLRTACQEVKRWPGLFVSVNVSAVQFRQSDVVETVRGVLTETGLEADRLELELTESVLMEDTGSAVGSLKRLSGLGVKLAMDDFGTGYSSLSYLSSLPFDNIKIDRSFIHRIGSAQEAEAVARAIVTLGHELRMRTTAEGIENEDQLTFLLGQGCDELQGFYLGRPMTADAIEAWRHKAMPVVAPGRRHARNLEAALT